MMSCVLSRELQEGSAQMNRVLRLCGDMVYICNRSLELIISAHDVDPLFLELKSVYVATFQIQEHPKIYKYSSFSKLIHLIAYCNRFINNISKNTERIERCLTKSELN